MIPTVVDENNKRSKRISSSARSDELLLRPDPEAKWMGGCER